jgi:hypothetical protein
VILCPAIAGAQSAALVTVPVLTPVYVRLEQEMSTKTIKPGDHFRIAVAEDVLVEGQVVIPAGSAGEGEVIDAAKPGFGGKAAKLVLAARYVKVGETEVRLRSFVLGASGKDHSTGALASSFVIGPLALFVHGGEVVVPAGTLASAKTAIELQMPVVDATGTPLQQPTVQSDN